MNPLTLSSHIHKDDETNIFKNMEICYITQHLNIHKSFIENENADSDNVIFIVVEHFIYLDTTNIRQKKRTDDDDDLLTIDMNDYGIEMMVIEVKMKSVTTTVDWNLDKNQNIRQEYKTDTSTFHGLIMGSWSIGSLNTN
ncbi:CLUMA_CG006678, isoform A [Clunio marinus]|uniref:CLUMA_CG006678, isoform A n=1 Tax=Clunio marinus TaxID=568069 RepID=A0A1J1I0G4_9DIPT|nr:CLUMA_CG006678, isoform A [Clunio marinus]